MSDCCWNGERFGTALKARLLALLSRERDASALTTAVNESAATAEAACLGRPMACAPGCPHCCLLNVAILLPEGMIIAGWLRERLSSPELGELRKRLASHRSWARWMDDEERIIKRMSCPFLDASGSCSIHTVRPLACRAAASLDSQCCREAFSPEITDEMRSVPADLMRQAAFDEAFSALAAALRHYGIDDRSIELGTGVLAFLEYPHHGDLLVTGGRLPGELWL